MKRMFRTLVIQTIPEISKNAGDIVKTLIAGGTLIDPLERACATQFALDGGKIACCTEECRMPTV